MQRAKARNYHRVSEKGLPVTRARSTTTRSQRAAVAVVVLAGGLLLGIAGPALAQVTTVETVPPEVDEDGRTAGERVDRIVVTLRLLAGVVIVGTAAYWWQTRPATRLARAVADPGPPDGDVREVRMPTIQLPDELEAVTLLPAMGAIADFVDHPGDRPPGDPA